MKKRILIVVLSLLLVSLQTIAQTVPYFLQGTWKMEGQKVYEHWDNLNESHMKGVSYAVNNNGITIIEYLDIVIKEKKITYTATVPGQNQGQSIEFIQTISDSLIIFENPRHDFPQRIAYQKISDTEISVNLSGGDKKMSYMMIKYSEDSKNRK